MAHICGKADIHAVRLLDERFQMGEMKMQDGLIRELETSYAEFLGIAESACDVAPVSGDDRLAGSAQTVPVACRALRPSPGPGTERFHGQ